MRLSIEQIEELVGHAIKRGDELVEIHPEILRRLINVGLAAKLCIEDNDLQHEDFSGHLDILASSVRKLESDL